MNQCACTGWWQQAGFGRQMMRNLELRFHGARIEGSGVDVIAPFELSGTLRTAGTVEILKQYKDRHSVVYVGRYDGEGTLFGSWAIGGQRGEWSIHLERYQSATEMEIQEIQPTPR